MRQKQVGWEKSGNFGFLSTSHEALTGHATYCKLRPLIYIFASSTEIAVPWDFSSVCEAFFVLCWWFFVILRIKLFVSGDLSCEKKDSCHLASVLFFFARSLAKQNVLALGWGKIVSISTKSSHTHRKKSQGAVTSMEDAITNTVHTSGIETSCVQSVW